MPKKRIILMYISDVSGHRSASEAIAKAINGLDPEAEVLNINAFHYTNPVSEKIINRIYMSVIQKTPQLWDYLYDNPKVAKRLEKIKDRIHKFNSPKLKRLFDEFRPDAVACTQAFPCGMVADFKKEYASGIRLVAVLTDFIPHSYWIYDTVDYYISPSEEVRSLLIKKGVPAQKIRNLGIPFDQKFNREVRVYEVRKKLKFSSSAPTVLIMGGGHGLGPIKTIVRSLEKVKLPLQEIIVCGINKKLYRSLKKIIKKCRNKIALFGFVDNINELMSIADIIITKPGGVTTAEALVKGLPMIIVKPIPGQEVKNADYLTKQGAAIRIDKPREISLAIEGLLTNQNKLKQMRQAAFEISKPNASLEIARLILNL